MNYKPLGNLPIQLPEIGFGTWKYGGGIAPLRAAIEQGAYLIDTAETYGTEATVGEAIRGLRSRAFVATKARPRNFRRRDLIAAAEGSLKRLGIETIDLYQLHWPNETIPIAETMQGMADLVDAGKVRFIGVSNFSVRALKKAQAALPKYRIVSNQVRYNLIDRTIYMAGSTRARHPEGGLLDYCRQNAITILAFSPLASGVDTLRAADPEGVLPRIAAAVGKTEAQVALNWVISESSVIALAKGSTVERVLENCGGSGWRLPPDALHELSSKIRFRRRGTIESALRRLARFAFQMAGKEM